tara:strand:+ start:284 stop:712 length:429 start_codon:yes stop_codon:yes gene_type:complete
MAQLYKSKDGTMYLAASDTEKTHIYERGLEVAQIIKEDGVPAGWNKYDSNAVSITNLCKPFNKGGKFIDLQLKQIHKYQKMLDKLSGVAFVDLFDIDIDSAQLDSEEVRDRMVHRRALEASFKSEAKLTNKINKSVGNSLFR